MVAYLLVYTRVTPHDEFKLIRDNDPAAAVALGLSLLGFVLPVVSAIAHSANVVDCLIWSAIALIVQIAVFFIVKIPVPNLSARIAAGEMASAIWLGLSSVAAGALNAASMIYLTMDDKQLAEQGIRQSAARSRHSRRVPAKRSGHVALLLMGTLAVGGGAYALMPRGNCQPASPGHGGAGGHAASDRLCAALDRSGGGHGGYCVVALELLQQR